MDPPDIASLLGKVVGRIPESAGAVLQEQVLKVTSGNETTTGFVTVFGVAIAIYGTMKGVMTLLEALNIAYEEDETRGFIKLYRSALLITRCAILGLAVAISGGPRLASSAGWVRAYFKLN